MVGPHGQSLLLVAMCSIGLATEAIAVDETSAQPASQEVEAIANTPAVMEAAPATSAAGESLPVIPVEVSQEQSELAAPKRRVTSALIEEVVVTAQKREENVQDVPVSISTFSADQLTALGVTEPTKLTLVTPGLQFNELAGFSVTFLRGVGSDAFLMADPSVALYVDEVYMPFAMAANKKFGELDRIEVLKGPQGTLFGRNAVGGAISIVTKKPRLDAFSAAVDLEYGSYNKQGIRAFVNIPILDDLAISATGVRETRDSYYNGSTGVSVINPEGNSIRGEKTTGAQAKAFYTPTDWLEVLLSASHAKSLGAETSYAVNDRPSALGKLLGIQAQSGFDGTSRNVDGRLGGETKVYSANVKFAFEPLDIKVIGAKQEISSFNFQDFDGSPVPLVEFDVINNYADIDSIELQVSSNKTSWASDRWNWIFGGYWSDGISAVDPNSLSVGATLISEGRVDLGGNELPPEIVSMLPPSLLAILPSGGVTVTGILGTRSTSGFFQTTYHFTDWLAATAGGRYQEETRKLIDSRSYLETIDGGQGAVFIDGRGAPPLTSKNFAPKISLELRPYDGLLVYASYQEAEKSATYNVFNPLDGPEKVKSESIKAYEIGFKSDFLDRLVRFNGAAFYYDQSNYVVQYISLLAGGALAPQNAPASRVKGFEFDVTADVMPSIFNGLYLTLSGAYVDAKFTDFHNCAGFRDENDPVLPGVFSPNLECTGNRIPRSPELTGRLGLNKIFTLDTGSIEVAGDVYANSGYFTLSTNSRTSEQPAFEVVNAYLKYNYEPFNLSATLYANNVLDKLYTQSIINTDFGNFVSYAEPRIFGIRLNWRY